MRTAPAFLSFLFLSGITPVFAQKPIPTIPPGGGTSTITRPDSLADQGYGFFMANATANVVAGGALSGKVEIQGNPLLWEPVTVVLSCRPGTAALTVQTDPRGNYTIDHTDVPRVYQMTDADALSTQIRQHYEGCSLQAPLPGIAPLRSPSQRRICAISPFSTTSSSPRTSTRPERPSALWARTFRRKLRSFSTRRTRSGCIATWMLRKVIWRNW